MENFYNAGVGPETMMIVRRSHSHAVHVFWRRSSTGQGVVMTRLECKRGEPPNVEGLVGPIFHTTKALRGVVLRRMKTRLDNIDDGDIHDD